MTFFLWLRSSRSLPKGSTPKSSVLRLLSSLHPPFSRSQPPPPRRPPRRALRTSALTGGWTISLPACWTMNTQLDRDLSGLEALEAVEPWPPACSSPHAGLRSPPRTAARSLERPLQAQPARAPWGSVKVGIQL